MDQVKVISAGTHIEKICRTENEYERSLLYIISFKNDI